MCQSLDPKIVPRGLKDSFELAFTFKHSSMLESLHAIGNPSATHLPIKGVCLADLNDNPEPIRVYTTNIADKEMERIVESASRVNNQL